MFTYRTLPNFCQVDITILLPPAKYENCSCFSFLPTLGLSAFLFNVGYSDWFVMCYILVLKAILNVFIFCKFFPDHFKGGRSGLNQSKNFLDPKELMELLKSRDYER